MENANQNKGFNRLKAVLADKGKTNRWLAGQMGKSENTVSRWSANKIQPSVEQLSEIAHILDVNIQELLRQSKMAYTDANNVRFSDDRKVLEKAPSTIGSEYTIPNGVDTVGKNAFNTCEDLKKITIPQSVKKVENGAFNGCKIEEIYYDGTLEEWFNLDWKALIESPYKLFVNHILLTYAVIPLAITKIRPNCFYYCTSLTGVQFHDRVEVIDESAFNKSGIKGNLVLPNGLQKIKQYAFFNCLGLTEVTMPKTLIDCYYGAFSCCYNLKEIKVSPENNFIGATNGLLYTKKDGCLRAIVRNKYSSSPLTLPIWIKKIARDTFCFGNLPQKGVVLNHEVEIINDAFRKAVGKVMVLPSLKHYYINSDIPKNILSDLFTTNGAFNNTQNRLTVISDNPFRVLGVYADSSQREINSNATKIKRYLEIGRQVSFDIDLNNSLPPVKRTNEAVDRALSQINQPKDRLQHAMFWLLKPKTQGDEEAYKSLFNGDFLGARSHLNVQTSAQVSVNAFCLSQILYGINNISEEIRLWLNYRLGIAGTGISRAPYDEFTKLVCGDNYSIDKEEFERLFLDELLKDIKPLYLWILVKSFRGHDYAKQYLYDRAIGEPIKRINAEILKAKNVNAKDSAASYKAAMKLKGTTNDDILIVKDFVDETDAKRALVSDGLATQILQSSINYYNSASNVQLVARNTLSLMEYSKSIAEGKNVIKRCEDNIKTVKEVVDSLPPNEVMNEAVILDRMCDDYYQKPKTVSNALTFLKACEPYIVKVKNIRESESLQDKKDKIFKYLMRVSTDIVAICLNNLIEEVNEAIAKNSSNVSTLHDQAWKSIRIMDQLPIDPVFDKERYTPNREILAKSHFGNLSFMGNRKYHDYTTVDFRTEKETWDECVSKKWYKDYIQKYPNGIHVLEAKQKQIIAEKEKAEREKKNEEQRRQREIENRLKKEAERREAIEKGKVEKENSTLNWVIGISIFLSIMNVVYMLFGWSGVGIVLFIIVFLVVGGLVNS